MVCKESVIDRLAEIRLKRTGGIEAIKGFAYQFKYALLQILSVLPENEKNRIAIEGVEDIDFYNTSEKECNFFQLKKSSSKIDASFFVSKGVLKNFIEIYLKSPHSTLWLVSDNYIANGHLQHIKAYSHSGKQLPEATVKYWEEKCWAVRMDNLSKTDGHWDWDEFNLLDFLSHIKFRKVKEDKIDKETVKALNNCLAEIDITSNTQSFYNALAINCIVWAIERREFTYSAVKELFVAVKHDIEKGTVNRAIRQEWIFPVEFKSIEGRDVVGYFDGQPAKPFHVAMELPVRRTSWEKEILESIQDFDVTVIQASSGQGKSTLAWCCSSILSETVHKIYELKVCKQEEDIGEIKEFVKDRVLLGEYPLIVIDGLNSNVRAWSDLVERALDLPVKFLITSREEEWFEFGRANIPCKIKPISISLEYDEAKAIFKKLLKNNRIFDKTIEFQTAWEHSKGLLIEYIYYITHGQMLEVRLSEQIARLHERRECEKIEIIRLVSVATMCNVKLHTSDVLRYITSEFGREIDLNSAFKSLENEYQIYLEGNNYIEGLHHVRSEHISKITHSSVPFSETLKCVVKLISNEELFPFCSQAIYYIDDVKEQHEFITFLAEYVSDGGYDLMTKAIEGAVSVDARCFWEKNKDVFDELYAGKGGLIYASDSVPWQTPIFRGFYENLLKIEDEEKVESAKQVIQYHEFLDNYKYEESNSYFLIKQLFEKLLVNQLNVNLKGLAELSIWFERNQFLFPLLSSINLQLLENNSQILCVEDFGKVLKTVYEKMPELYFEYLNKHRDWLVSYVKTKTDTITIDFREDSVLAEYIADNRDSNLNLSNESNCRARTLSLFFPAYDFYEVRCLYPPISLYSFVRNDYDPSYKKLENNRDLEFYNQRSNEIWLEKINENYGYRSLYEWQSFIYEIRSKGVVFIEECNACMGYLLSDNLSKMKKLAKANDERKHQLKVFRDERKKSSLPQMFEDVDKELIKGIDTFLSSFDNVLNQWVPVDEEKWRLFIINLSNCRRKLKSMQLGFDLVVSNTIRYFDTNGLDKEEIRGYSQFEKTCLFYFEHKDIFKRISTIKQDIDAWYENTYNKLINDLSEKLLVFQAKSGLEIIAPTSYIEEGNLKTVVIGIQDISFQEFDLSVDVFCYLILELQEIAVDYFVFVFVDQDCIVLQNSGLSISRSFLKELSDSIERGEIYDWKKAGSFPVQITETHLESNPSLKLQDGLDMSKATQLKFIVLLWEISEIRKRLKSDVAIEKKWKERLEKETKKELKIIMGSDEFQCFPLVLQNELKAQEIAVFENKEIPSDRYEMYYRRIIYPDLDKLTTPTPLNSIDDLFSFDLSLIPNEGFRFVAEELNAAGTQIQMFRKDLIISECGLFEKVEVALFQNNNKNVIFSGVKRLTKLPYIEKLLQSVSDLYGRDKNGEGALTQSERYLLFDGISCFDREWEANENSPTLSISFNQKEIILILFDLK